MAALKENVKRMIEAGVPEDEITKYIQDYSPISTITGKPIQTGTEDIKQSTEFAKKLVQEGAPIAGDIAMSMLAPQVGLPLKVPGVKPFLARQATKLGNLALRSGGAAAGSGAGEFAGQQLTGEDANIEDITQQALLGAGGEVGIAGAGVAVKPLKPVADMLSSGTMSGGAIKQFFRRRLIEKTTERASKFAQALAPVDVQSKASLGLQTGDFFENLTDFNTAYKPFNEAVERAAAANNGEILIDDTTELLSDFAAKFKDGRKTDRQAVNEMVSALGFTGSKRQIAAGNALGDMLRDGFTNPNDLQLVMSNIWTKFGQDSQAMINFKRQLKETLVDDIERFAPDLPVASMGLTVLGAKKAKSEADKIFGEIKTFLKETPTVSNTLQKSRISNNTRALFLDKPELIIDRMFQNAQPEELIRIRDVLRSSGEGVKIWEGLRHQWVKDLIEGSMAPLEGAGKASGLKMFMPDDFANKVQFNERNIKAVLGEELWESLSKEVEYFNMVAPQFAKFERGQGANVLRGALLPAFAGTLGGMSAIPVTEAFGAITAFSLMSPATQKIISQLSRVGLKTGIRFLPQNQELKRSGNG